MKTNFLVAVLCMCTIAPIMTNAATPEVVWFKVDQQNYFLVNYCTPGSKIELYSKPWGGKLLQTATADGQGSILLTRTDTLVPAFAINRTAPNATGAAGSGKVGFRGPQEFAMQQMTGKIAGGNIIINWQGQTFGTAPIVFEVVKSKDDVHYTTVGTYKAGGQAENYTCTDKVSDTRTLYYIKAVNTTEGLRYTAPVPVNGTGTNDVVIYPTITTNALNVLLPSTAGATNYCITDMLGRVVGKGNLQAGSNTVNVTNLLPGNYLVSVPGNTSVKIVKY